MRGLFSRVSLIVIRQATLNDFDAILDMCEEFWSHTQFTEPFEREHCAVMVQMSYDHGLLAVYDSQGPQGFIAAVKSPLLGSAYAITATELAWWVNPPFRGTMAGIKLVNELERLSKLQDVKYLNMAFMETSMPQAVRTLYEKLGYTLQETVFTKVLNHGSSNSNSCVGRSSRLFG